jgi:ribosome modulation factor
MMKSNEVSTATLEQLTNELAAAGWDSTQTNIEDAREAVLNLIAENMVASHNRNNSPDGRSLCFSAWYSDAYNTGFESCKQGEPREDNPYHIDAFSRDAWFAGWDDAI